MYQVEYQNKDIVIRFDRNSIDKKFACNLLASLLEYLEIEQIRKKSKLTEKQAKLLAKEINQKVWKKIKDKFIED
jgi:hypothetical protein